MSTEMMRDIACPQCGERQKYKMYASINSENNPELKPFILDETLFDWRCKRCNYLAQMVYPVLYMDPKAKYAVILCPKGVQDSVETTAAVEEYTKRKVKNLSELKEKILIFDSGLEDVAVELVKNALCEIVKNTYKAASAHAYFSRVTKGEIEFAIFLPKRKEPVYHSTKLEVYAQSGEVVRSLNFRCEQGFAKVDAKLAKRLIEEYEEQ